MHTGPADLDTPQLQQLREKLSAAVDAVSTSRDLALQLHMADEARWLDIIWNQLYAVGFGRSADAKLDIYEQLTWDAHDVDLMPKAPPPGTAPPPHP